MDVNWQNLFNQQQQMLPGYYGQVQPMSAAALNAAYNNPYAQQYIQNAAGLSGQGAQAGSQALGAAGQIYQTSMDPQQALYNRTLQQIQDQSRAASAAAGLGTSAAGVGLENQAVGNFNIDWQNQQLQRQLQGAQGAGNVSNQALNMMLGTYGLPYQAGMAVPAGQQAALGQYTGTIGAYPAAMQQQMNQAANYMQLGQAAQGNAFNQAYQNAMAQQQQAASLGQGITGAYNAYQNQQLINNMIQQPYYGANYGGNYISPGDLGALNTQAAGNIYSGAAGL
jgi:hypothetical protein